MFLFNLIPEPYRTLIMFGVLVAIGGGAFYEGYEWEYHSEQSKVVEAQTHVIEVQKEQDAVSNDVETKAIKQEIETKVIYQTIEKKVPVYVTKHDDSNCVVPTGFVSLHNAAASGLPDLPDAASNVNDAPSGVELSEVASTITVNYEQYHQLETQLKALQEWVREQQALAGDK